MSARTTLALGIALWMLVPTAGADEPASAASESLQTPVPADVSDRGLQPRMTLAGDAQRVYVPSTASTSEAPLSKSVPANGDLDLDLDLSQHLALNLRPASLHSPSQAGRSVGYGDIVLSVPLSDSIDLRTGVRVDYDSSPGSETLDAEATPTIGVGFEF
jgi:hypothetical protein